MIKNAELALMNRAEDERSFDAFYGSVVEGLIRRRYSQSQENAILRKKLAGLYGAEQEFYEFNQYAEQCKIEAKGLIGI